MNSSFGRDGSAAQFNKARALVNTEGLDEFNREWQWSDRSSGAITAVLRVKNEAPNLPFVLPPLFRSVDRLIMIDNQSTDGTADLAAQLATKHGAAKRFKLLSYPFQVSRCGSDHRETPPASVHSLSYFYNWSFSHATSPYAMKWDGDMVITESGERVIRALAWQLEGAQRIISFSLYPLWVKSEKIAYLDVSRDNHEARIWPNRKGIEFLKARNYETIRTLKLPRIFLGPGSVFEIKRLSENEFDHWTRPEDFNNTESLAPRKSREWYVAQQLSAGIIPAGVVAVEAEPGEHVIETVRTMPYRRWREIQKGG